MSNSTFFKDFTPTKLAALDVSTRVSFAGEHNIVVYHTIDGEGLESMYRTLEAFVLDAEHGNLLRKMTWTSRSRQSGSELLDSEGRIVQLSKGRFLVAANGLLLLYDHTGQLLAQKKLEPFGREDLWAVQPLSAGQQIFLRHQSALSRETTYYWLALDSLSIISEMQGFHGSEYSVGVTAGHNFVLLGSPDSGIRMIKQNGSEETICNATLCRQDHTLSFLDQHRIGISGREGFGILDIDKGLTWSKTLALSAERKNIQVGNIRWALSGTAFAVWLQAIHSQLFDGIKVGQSPTVFVFDPELSSHVLAMNLNPVDFDFDFALSPSGDRMAVFDGSNLKIYQMR